MLPRASSPEHELRQAAIAYDQARADQRRQGNRLMYILRQYYPTAIAAFPSVTSLTCLAFLEAYPTPKAAQQLSLADLWIAQKEDI